MLSSPSRPVPARFLPMAAQTAFRRMEHSGSQVWIETARSILAVRGWACLGPALGRAFRSDVLRLAMRSLDSGPRLTSMAVQRGMPAKIEEPRWFGSPMEACDLERSSQTSRSAGAVRM